MQGPASRRYGGRMREASSAPVRRRLLAACTAFFMILFLGACGGGQDEGGASETAASSPQQEEQQRQSSPERGGDTTPGDDEDTGSDPDAESGESGAGGGSCPDVVITPNSGDGLFEVEAEGMSCDEAVTALKKWGQAGYPGQGPQGFECDDSVDDAGTAPTELRCVERGSDAVIEFATGV